MGILTKYDKATGLIVPKELTDPHDMHQACVDAMTKIACERDDDRKSIFDFVIEMIKYQAKLFPEAKDDLNKVVNILKDVKEDLKVICLYLQE